MAIRELIIKNRSYRRFIQDHKVSLEILRELVELARHSASGSNIQPLKYFLSSDPESNAAIFNNIKWAGYLTDWDGPVEGERPSAYIVILGDQNITEHFGVDHGIAAQSVMLGAAEKGLGGCMIAWIEKESLVRDLKLSEHLTPLLVLALGKPNEKVVIDSVGSEGNIEYWRDQESVHHVPKRSLDELIIG